MKRDVDAHEEQLIDLGAVTAETKGPPGPHDDGQGQRFQAGLSND